MSIEAQVAVLNMIDELTPDEYRLLSIITQTCASGDGFVWPMWDRVLDMAHMSSRQCGRVLRGLHSEELVKFVAADPKIWLSLFDPRFPIPIQDGLGMWIAGMTETDGARAPRREYYKKKPIPSGIRQAVFERDNYTCRHCGANDCLTVDHIQPESLGGTLDLSNLQTLCRSCNSRKGNRITE